MPGLPDLLYRNTGDGRFVEVGRETGIAALPARGLGVVCHDFTGDGRPDFYVANDTEANHLWVNQGDGAFTEEALLLGAALSGFGRPEAGMGIEIGDLSGDGVLDILLTHFADETNTVYLAEPFGFVDGSIDLGLGTLGLSTTGFGVALADFDLDGFLDAVIANGRVARPPGESPRLPFFEQYGEGALILRGGSARFADAGAGSPDLSEAAVVGRGLAAGDLDGDGDPDLVLTAAEGPARVFENVSRPRRELVARGRPTACRRPRSRRHRQDPHLGRDPGRPRQPRRLLPQLGRSARLLRDTRGRHDRTSDGPLVRRLGGGVSGARTESGRDRGPRRRKDP